MVTLFIDVASHTKLFALIDGENVSSVSVNDHTDEQKLMSTIEKLLQDRVKTLNDIDRVAVVIGPGGFMSLRVGVSLANALSYALQIPSAGIHASDVWKTRVHDADWVWLHSTKREQLFIRGFGPFARQWKEATLVGKGVLTELPKGTLFAGDIIDEHKALLSACEALQNVRSIDDVLPQLVDTAEYAKKQTLLPWYGREG